MKTSFLLLVFLSIAIPAVLAQESTGHENDKGKHPGKKDQTEVLLNRREFTFKATRAIPSRGSSIDLTTNPNYMNFYPDLVESYMPFFGRAYSGVGYGKDTGLHFKGQPDTFSVDKKKNNYQVTVNVKGGSDIFRIFLIVSPGGNASVTITSNNREAISFIGEITPLKE
jgi:hypothetical protein